jgi:hypothetical protein
VTKYPQPPFFSFPHQFIAQFFIYTIDLHFLKLFCYFYFLQFLCSFKKTGLATSGPDLLHVVIKPEIDFNRKLIFPTPDSRDEGLPGGLLGRRTYQVLTISRSKKVF